MGELSTRRRFTFGLAAAGAVPIASRLPLGPANAVETAAHDAPIAPVVPKEPATTLAKYDDMVRARDKYSTSNNARSESSVIKTISE